MPNPGYLKNYRPVLYYFRDAYGLSVNEIEFLFHVYDMKYFNYSYIIGNFRASDRFASKKVPRLNKLGYLFVYLDKTHNRERRFAISQKGKLLVSRFYRVLEGKEIVYR
jgi:hypothetical protein